MTATLWALVAGGVIAALGMIKAFMRGGKSASDAIAAASTKADLKAERERIALDDEIAHDSGLVARAHDIGLVRPETDG